MHVDQHVCETLSRPALIGLGEGNFLLRFESMKVASAGWAVADLLARGVIDDRSTLIDSSSGIYAYALALTCHRFGLGCHVVASAAADPSLLVQLDLLGASYEQMPSGDDLALDQNLRVARVHEYVRTHPGAYWMQQYHDRIHYEGYRRMVAPFLAENEWSRVRLVSAVGSGASSAGLARGLRDLGAEVQVHGVQPFGSVSFGSEEVSDPDMMIAGIGSAIDFANIDDDLFDTIDWVSFAVACSGSHELMRRQAIFAGLSTGAAFMTASSLPRTDGAVTLVISPDTGHRYTQRVFARPAAPVTDWVPRMIEHRRELTLPWCRRLRPADGWAAHRRVAEERRDAEVLSPAG
ncbi:pyridoxal-phosphate dependent enzyme [Austwickia chelonae]|uniref:pyridoxal-phosphate dependent enzyme n=1 Tax=Austwickia chelonae TaxID=100225 RepID=UPI000E243BBF|nr:pyridoxal-phosphate dependent enzyme [Austwickia chelonae]